MYTRKRDWDRMAGGVTDFARLPLWTPCYDGVDELAVMRGRPWVPFGGWTAVAAKQYQGTTRIHGVSVDTNIADARLLE